MGTWFMDFDFTASPLKPGLVCPSCGSPLRLQAASLIGLDMARIVVEPDGSFAGFPKIIDEYGPFVVVAGVRLKVTRLAIPGYCQSHTGARCPTVEVTFELRDGKVMSITGIGPAEPEEP